MARSDIFSKHPERSVTRLYFEDYAVGGVSKTRTRTITEADIVNFAGLSGDFVELHVSEEYAKNGPFGRRIAHGLLTLSIASGLMVQAEPDQETIVAFYGIDKLRFLQPVFIGDTITVTKKVLDLRLKEDRGVVGFETTVLNQRDEPVLVFLDRLMVKTRG
ncbi:MAG: MaoC/PaaZ C-terminal domain-containing protein [Bryobacteraceae bacterium]